eukprot:CFRG2159T1
MAGTVSPGEDNSGPGLDEFREYELPQDVLVGSGYKSPHRSLDVIPRTLQLSHECFTMIENSCDNIGSSNADQVAQAHVHAQTAPNKTSATSVKMDVHATLPLSTPGLGISKVTANTVAGGSESFSSVEPLRQDSDCETVLPAVPIKDMAEDLLLCSSNVENDMSSPLDIHSHTQNFQSLDLGGQYTFDEEHSRPLTASSARKLVQVYSHGSNDFGGQLDKYSSSGHILGEMRESDIGSASELFRTPKGKIFSRMRSKHVHHQPTARSIRKLSWYEPNAKRADIELALAKTQPGTFVIRHARTGEDYCLSVRSDIGEVVVHILIERQTGGLQLGGDNIRFRNMQDLVTYYKKHQINIDGQLTICLKKSLYKSTHRK